MQCLSIERSRTVVSNESSVKWTRKERNIRQTKLISCEQTLSSTTPTHKLQSHCYLIWFLDSRRYLSKSFAASASISFVDKEKRVDRTTAMHVKAHQHLKLLRQKRTLWFPVIPFDLRRSQDDGRKSSLLLSIEDCNQDLWEKQGS